MLNDIMVRPVEVTKKMENLFPEEWQKIIVSQFSQ